MEKINDPKVLIGKCVFILYPRSYNPNRVGVIIKLSGEDKIYDFKTRKTQVKYFYEIECIGKYKTNNIILSPEYFIVLDKLKFNKNEKRKGGEKENL